MYASGLSYNITRPYPFRWFTPVTIIGGIIVLVVFSLLNLSTTGYDIITVYTTSPNETLASHREIFSWGLQGAAKAQCQMAIIPAYAQVTTNNSAMTYKVTSIQQATQDLSPPSFTYLNAILEDCTVNSIAVNLESFDRPAVERARSAWGASALGSATCYTNSSQGRTEIGLQVSYDIGTTDPTAIPSVPWPGRNATLKSSLYWGETLMNLYWRKLVVDAANSGTQVQAGARMYKGFVYLIPPGPQDTTPVTSPDFFRPPSCFFYSWPDANETIQEGVCQQNVSDPNLSYSMLLNGSVPLGGGLDIWSSLDILGKAFYSSIMVDLGQRTPSPNLLVDPNLLQSYTSNLTGIINAIAIGVPESAGLATAQFDPSNQTPGYPHNLGVRNSTILSEYACQQRRWKAPGALILSTLVANVAFLATTWKIFSWGVSSYIKRQQPGSNSCAGGVCAFDATENTAQRDYDEQRKLPLVQPPNLVAMKRFSDSDVRLLDVPSNSAHISHSSISLADPITAEVQHR